MNNTHPLWWITKPLKKDSGVRWLEIKEPSLADNHAPKVTDPILVAFGISQIIYDKWVSTYEREYVDQELKKADVWLVANPKKHYKNKARFMNNWLAKGFEKYQKSIPSNKINTSDYSYLEENVGNK